MKTSGLSLVSLVSSMFVSLALSFLALGTGCGSEGSSSPRAACEDLTVSLCTQLYTCLSPAELAVAGYPASEAACVTQYQQVLGCAAQTLDNACVGNETYHADKAARCTDQVEGLECTQLRDPNFELETGAPACGQVCTVD
jgi:hypothetical protein